MGKKMKTVEILIIIVIILFIGVLTINTNDRNNRVADRIQRCEAGGWTWLGKEGKCIMVKELK